MIFYGAGQNMRVILEKFEHHGIIFNYPIWDINAGEIQNINGHAVTLPDFYTLVSGESVIITISDPNVSAKVKTQLENLGYDCNLSALLMPLPSTPVTLDNPSISYPIEFTQKEKEIIYDVRKNELSMVTDEGLAATLKACKYVIENNIDGDFVECGVWRGGNAIIAAEIFKLYGSDKKIWLFDTFGGFEGLERSEHDHVHEGIAHTWTKETIYEELYNPNTCKNSIKDVKRNFEKRSLLNENIIFVPGDVSKTLESGFLPKKTSVLRLDTDWYKSTKKEMEILYPLLSKNGVFIIDDYGYCRGSQKAVDEYFADKPAPMLMCAGYNIRVGIKTD
jgi:hypothetical protein